MTNITSKQINNLQYVVNSKLNWNEEHSAIKKWFNENDVLIHKVEDELSMITGNYNPVVRYLNESCNIKRLTKLINRVIN